VKLNPEDLNVSSFDTSADALNASAAVVTDPLTIKDPTAATRCYICPAETQNYCY
jgi:hypothetical protein